MRETALVCNHCHGTTFNVTQNIPEYIEEGDKEFVEYQCVLCKIIAEF